MVTYWCFHKSEGLTEVFLWNSVKIAAEWLGWDLMWGNSIQMWHNDKCLLKEEYLTAGYYVGLLKMLFWLYIRT